MKNLEIKKNILQEIMDMMDSHEAEGLKKHPKLMAAKIEVAKPMEDVQEEPSEELQESEDMPVDEDQEEPVVKEDMNPEDMERLMELYKRLKS